MRVLLFLWLNCSPLFLLAQETLNASSYLDEDFSFATTDTIYQWDEVKAVRYLQPQNNMAFFVEPRNDGETVETGYRKNGIYVGEWKRYDDDGVVIKSLNFDTLVVQADSIVKIAEANAFDPVTSEIDFLFDEMWPGDSLEDSWIITTEFKDVHYREISGISVNAMTGKRSSYGYSITEQPVLTVPDTTVEMNEGPLSPPKRSMQLHQRK